MKICANMSEFERLLRVDVGVALIVLHLVGVIGFWGYIGVVFVITALLRWCPLYTLMGRDNCGCHMGSPKG